VLDVSDEDATRMLATCPQQVVRVGLVEFGERHDIRTNGKHHTVHRSRPPVDQSGKARGKLNGEVTRTLDTRDILVASCVSGVSTRMSRGCYEETAPVGFQLNDA